MTTVQQILGRRPIHPFPARMAPSIALDAIGKSRRQLRILDPMVGSGTVVAVAKAQGHKAVGLDCDPLSVLNASVWTRGIDHRTVLAKAEVVLGEAEVLYRQTAPRDAYPVCADEETRKFLRYWYDQNARRELNALSVRIGSLRNTDARNALWSAFSRMIIAKKAGVSLAMDLSHSRPHKVYRHAPVRPFEQFMRSAFDVVSNCPERRKKGSGPATDIRLGDCRHLPFRKSSFDLVVTSPPYLNAIDYMRCSKFSLVWMGHRISDLREVRGSSVGTGTSRSFTVCEKFINSVVDRMTSGDSLTSRMQTLIAVYVDDMVNCINEVSRVLRPNGSAVFVIGDNQIGDVVISNSEAIKVIAHHSNLKLESENTRDLPANRRYLPPPTAGSSGQKLQGRMRSEVVLRFQRRS